MIPRDSIRARLLMGAALVMLAFMAGAGVAVQRAHADSVRAAHYARLQGTIYLLLARAELDATGALLMPPAFAEPRLTLPQSGLYARIRNLSRGEEWRSASTLGADPPFPQAVVPPGEWRQETLDPPQGAYLAVSYGVNWATGERAAPLTLTVLESRAGIDREIAVFTRTLWAWLGAAGVLLLLAQTLLLRWGLGPLRRVAQEVRRIEDGQQLRIEGHYPGEIRGLTENLNAMIQQERARQGRYREALSFLAHSLKTPLAVMRAALSDPAQLGPTVEQQVGRMDAIVQHQLARAAASESSRFAPAIAVAPVLERTRDALVKVHGGRNLRWRIACAPELAWRMDEGDLFEIVGNLMDNAAKWAGSTVQVRAWREGDALHLQVDDDGPGFTDTESILQLHVRLDERVPGHGVGLAVVKDLVASHRGELALERSELGGARVHLQLRTS